MYSSAMAARPKISLRWKENRRASEARSSRWKREQQTLEHRVNFATIDLKLAEEYKAQLSSPATFGRRQLRNATVNGFSQRLRELSRHYTFLRRVRSHALSLARDPVLSRVDAVAAVPAHSRIGNFKLSLNSFLSPQDTSNRQICGLQKMLEL